MAEQKNQSLACAQGDTYDLAIALRDIPEGTDLAGASAQWMALEGGWVGAAEYVSKEASVDVPSLMIYVHLDPEDTNLPVGSYFWQCRLTLSNGAVYHPSSGPFDVSFGS